VGQAVGEEMAAMCGFGGDVKVAGDLEGFPGHCKPSFGG
jgi:hypothetical protein